MQETINAIYENGVIKPLQKLHFKEHEKVTVTISKPTRKAKTKSPAMSLIGIFESGIGDLSREHDKYLYGQKKIK